MVDELVRLRRLGQPFGRIARWLGVTRGAAIEAALHIGLRVRVQVRQPPVSPLDEPQVLGGELEVVGRGACHWISGDVDSHWRMCGQKSVPGLLWCAHHAARVYRQVRYITLQRKDAA